MEKPVVNQNHTVIERALEDGPTHAEMQRSILLAIGEVKGRVIALEKGQGETLTAIRELSSQDARQDQQIKDLAKETATGVAKQETKNPVAVAIIMALVSLLGAVATVAEAIR